MSMEKSQIKMWRERKKERMEYPGTGGNYKWWNRCLMGTPEGEQREKWTE